VLARNWAAGRTVRNAPPEMAEFALLSRLGGYTRDGLEQEPASVVRRWLAMLEAEAFEQRKQAHKAETQGGKSGGRRRR